MATKTLLTVERFDLLPSKQGVQYELDKGELVTVTEPMPRHSLVRDRIARILGNFVDERKLGTVFAEKGISSQPRRSGFPMPLSFRRSHARDKP